MEMKRNTRLNPAIKRNNSRLPKSYRIQRFFCFSCSSSEISPENTTPGGQILSTANAFSFKKLRVATNDFHPSNKIGEGGFGSVYKGRLEDGKMVGIKVLSAESKQGDREFMSEIGSMLNISHQYLVKLHGGCIHGSCRILVYDYMENGSLFEAFLGERAKFSWKIRGQILLGIAEGLAYIHEVVKPHIVHRDIKASNILLDENFNAKVSDFGLSKLYSENITHISTRVAGTLGYLAPEYAISGHLTRKSDVYSFGVLLLEIVTGRKALDFDIHVGELYLVDKVWEMYRSNKLVQLVDPMLDENFIQTEAIRFLKVGLLCVQEKSVLRPTMSMAVKMMRDEINIRKTHITQPGLITDFMNVRIAQQQNKL